MNQNQPFEPNQSLNTNNQANESDQGQQPPAVSESPPSLGSVSSLFQDSWEILKKSARNILVIDVVYILMITAFIAAVMLIAGFYFMSSEIYKNLINNFSIETMTQVPATTYLFLPLIIFGLFIIFAGLMMAMTIALMLVVYQSSEGKKDISIGEIVRQSFDLVIPYYLVLVLCNLLVMGNYIWLIIPGLIITFLLFFAQFELVFQQKRGLSALRSSCQIVSQHFFEILGRLLVFWLALLFLSFAIGILTSSTEKSGLSIFSQLTSLIIQIGSGWFGLIYSVLLYKRARLITNFDKKGSLLVWGVASVIGWLIIIFFLYQIFIKINQIFNFDSLRNIKGTISQAQDIQEKKFAPITNNDDKIDFYQSSNCGLSIPIPKTTFQADTSPQQWLYEEMSVTSDQFYILDLNVYPVKNVLGAFLAFKKPNDEIDLNIESSHANYPGFSFLCIDNSQSLTLDEFTASALANKTYQVTKEEKVKWGEVELVPVTLTGTRLDQNQKRVPFKELAYLGISADQSRLLYIRVWEVPDLEIISVPELLVADQNVVMENLKYHRVDQSVEDIIVKVFD